MAYLNSSENRARNVALFAIIRAEILGSRQSLISFYFARRFFDILDKKSSPLYLTILSISLDARLLFDLERYIDNNDYLRFLKSKSCNSRLQLNCGAIKIDFITFLDKYIDIRTSPHLCDLIMILRNVEAKISEHKIINRERFVQRRSFI